MVWPNKPDKRGTPVRNLDTGEEFISINKAVESLKVPCPKCKRCTNRVGMGRNITQCISGASKTAYGYRWERILPKGVQHVQ